MKLTLVVLTAGKWEGKVIPITLSQFLIGRDPQCHLRPASPVISKRHCAVLVRNGKVFVRDFDSTNGTFVNDRQVKGEVELKHEDQLKVGPLAFTVRLEVEAPAAAPKPVPAKPAKTPVPAGATSENGEGVDDDAAHLLLSLGDDGTSGFSGLGDGVPDGSTVMEVMPPTAGTDPAGPAPTKEKDKPKPAASTAAAAKAILEKYTRRPRS
jgi:pSer/pThr/pTyr-binding forkhead associated (FHA) protein